MTAFEKLSWYGGSYVFIAFASAVLFWGKIRRIVRKGECGSLPAWRDWGPWDGPKRNCDRSEWCTRADARLRWRIALPFKPRAA